MLPRIVLQNFRSMYLESFVTLWRISLVAETKNWRRRIRGGQNRKLPLDGGKAVIFNYFSPRTDISYVVSVVSQFMQATYEEHMEVVNRIVKFFKSSPGKGLMFRKTNWKCIEWGLCWLWMGKISFSFWMFCLRHHDFQWRAKISRKI